MTAVGAMTLASCTSDDLVQNTEIAKNQGQIGFNMKVTNTTRAEKAQEAGHYEFGVFAMKGAKELGTNSTVMNNYLVAWTDGSNGLYKDLKSGATTWGDAASAADGQSQWFYEGLSSSNKTAYTTPKNTQILKYWDKSNDKHYFYAYTPYSTSGVSYTKADESLTFTSLSSFYTDPETNGTNKYQPTNAVKTAANALTATYNQEMVNYNEGLYDYAEITKADYEKDVPFTFNHINAQIKLKFYEDIPGYSVKLTDMVPTGTTGLTAQNGIVLTPAKETQATAFQQAAATDLPKYLESGTVVVKNLSEATPPIAVTGDGVNNLLYFQEAADAKIGTSSTAASLCPTTLYVLPNHDGSSYIDDNVSKETGYTLHVSYQLIPEDGSANTQVYDARVWIPADKCQWQAGKCYTYIFKITANSNGTSDPKKPDPAKETEYWVDPEDPRVPEDPDLQPIVFDGVVVDDYTGATTPEGTITENSMCNALSNAFKNITSPSGKLTWDLNDNEASITGIIYDINSPNTDKLKEDLGTIFNNLNTTSGTVTKIIVGTTVYELNSGSWTSSSSTELVADLLDAIVDKFDNGDDYTSPTITLSDGNKYYSFKLSATANSLGNALSSACKDLTPATDATLTCDLYNNAITLDGVNPSDDDFVTNLTSDLTAIFGDLDITTKITVGTVEYTYDDTEGTWMNGTDKLEDVLAAAAKTAFDGSSTYASEDITLSKDGMDYIFVLKVED